MPPTADAYLSVLVSVGKVIFVIGSAAASIAFSALCLMLAWNYAIPALFPLVSVINFWQAFCIQIIVKSIIPAPTNPAAQQQIQHEGIVHDENCPMQGDRA